MCIENVNLPLLAEVPEESLTLNPTNKYPSHSVASTETTYEKQETLQFALTVRLYSLTKLVIVIELFNIVSQSVFPKYTSKTSSELVVRTAPQKDMLFPDVLIVLGIGINTFMFVQSKTSLVESYMTILAPPEPSQRVSAHP